MKVRELIEKLRREDPDSEVTFFDGEVLSIDGKRAGKSETKAQSGEEYNREYGDEAGSEGYD